MNLDFHYYGTFVAACMAGYLPEDAKIIAFAAQFVDECDKSNLRNFGKVKAIPTVQSFSDMLDITLPMSEKNKKLQNSVREIWMPFHFLPGNIRCCKHSYQGDNSCSKPKWQYSDEQKKIFELLCCSDSEIATDMINDTVLNYSTNLHMIGIRMHVLADTWAHQYFAGTPSWFVNDYIGTIIPINEDNSRSASLEMGSKYAAITSDKIKDKKFSATGTSNDCGSIYYLGHGRVGHIPDYGCMHYGYRPQWNGGYEIIKNNPQEFMEAFKRMVYALRCIKNQNEYDPQKLNINLGEKASILERIFKTETIDQSSEWKKHLKVLLGGKNITLPSFNADAWVNKLAGEGSFQPTQDYIEFQKAAIKHRQFVEKFTSSRGVSMYTYDQPQEKFEIINFDKYAKNREKITQIIIRTGGIVDAIEFVYDNKFKTETLGFKLGGEEHIYNLKSDEYINEISGDIVEYSNKGFQKGRTTLGNLTIFTNLQKISFEHYPKAKAVKHFEYRAQPGMQIFSIEAECFYGTLTNGSVECYITNIKGFTEKDCPYYYNRH